MASDTDISSNSVDITTLEWEDMNIPVPATLTINSKKDKNNDIWESQLVFRTCKEPTGDKEHYCYLCYMADGRRIIIGSKERPYVITTNSQSLTDNMKDSQLWEITAKWSRGHKKPITL